MFFNRTQCLWCLKLYNVWIKSEFSIKANTQVGFIFFSSYNNILYTIIMYGLAFSSCKTHNMTLMFVITAPYIKIICCNMANFVTLGVTQHAFFYRHLFILLRVWQWQRKTPVHLCLIALWLLIVRKSSPLMELLADKVFCTHQTAHWEECGNDVPCDSLYFLFVSLNMRSRPPWPVAMCASSKILNISSEGTIPYFAIVLFYELLRNTYHF